MASIEERDEYAKQEEAGLEKQAVDLKEEDVRMSHPSFSFVSSSSPSQHRFINQPYFGGLSSIYDRSEGASSSGAGEAARGEEREHMFDKVVTPSDVGKLNRLVIPKQHAEKYFPLDSAANGKGLLLNFEDRSGKPWRFRYSYWNSSQSYVMTKGWSRFVKEKKLDAGDIVSFERCKAEGIDRFFIDWRRKPNVADPSLHGLPVHHRSMPWGRLLFPPIPRSHLHFNYGTYHYNVMNPASFNCLRPPGWPMIGGGVQYAGSIAESSPMVFDSVPLVQGGPATSGKRVRLFGVNLDCPTGEEADSHSDNPAAKSVFQPSPPSQLRPYGGGPAISGELQRKPKTSLSLDLDI